jgi:hypothetical protein
VPKIRELRQVRALDSPGSFRIHCGVLPVSKLQKIKVKKTANKNEKKG